jgi:glycosyltransferase involved in cell wall biosynthesis
MAVAPADEQRILALLPNYDIIWFFKLRVANFFSQWHWPLSVVDIDDVPSTYERAEQANSRGLKAFKAAVRAWVWQRRERLLGERFNAVCVCSEADRKQLPVAVPVHVIPNGYAKPSKPPVRNLSTPPRIGFIGLFDHLPNSDGVQWFTREVWPRIQVQLPGCRLRLVGKGSDGPLSPTGAGIERLGWLADADSEIATWSAMIVPIRLGAGTRVKIADALSRQCPVISTRLGAYGYDLKSGRELMLADDPHGFAQACVELIRQPEQANAMATRAYEAFLKNWTWEAITPRIHAAVQDCLRISKARGTETPQH